RSRTGSKPCRWNERPRGLVLRIHIWSGRSRSRVTWLTCVRSAHCAQRSRFPHIPKNSLRYARVQQDAVMGVTCDGVNCGELGPRSAGEDSWDGNSKFPAGHPTLRERISITFGVNMTLSALPRVLSRKLFALAVVPLLACVALAA